MYSISDEAKTAIKAAVIHTTLSGTLSDWEFTEDNILSGSFSITNQCSDDSELSIGSVYIGELKGTFLNCPANRNTLLGKKIKTSCNLKIGNSYEAIPLGEYFVQEVNWAASGVEITAYDAMSKFDKTANIDQTTGTIFGFLTLACDACGVSLGMTPAECQALTNGTETLVIRTDGSDIETYRDLLSWIAQTTCTIATINRDGKLVLREYGKTSVDSLDTTHRLSGGKFSDFITRYTGISVVNISDQTTSYYEVIPDDGLTYNLGSNPLLQVGVESVKTKERRAVLEKLATYKSTPMEIPVAPIPIYDLCDLITFTDGLAGNSSISYVTKYEWNFNSQLKLSSAGKDPALANAKSKTDKNISGLMSRAQADRESIRWYTYVNAKEIDVSDGVETNIIDMDYVTTKGGKVLFNAEILYDIETTSIEDTFNDAVVVATIYINDIAVADYLPTETVQDGRHHLIVMYPFNTTADTIGNIKVTLTISGGSAVIGVAKIQGYLMGSGLAGDIAWDGKIKIEDKITSDVEIHDISETIAEKVIASVQIPLSSVFADTIRTSVNILLNKNISDDVLTGTNIMVYRPGVNDVFVSLKNCSVSNNSWISSADGATVVIDRLYGIQSIKGYCDADVTFAFSPDGQNWKGYNAIAGEIQDDYEMPWSIVQEMTAELWASFDQYWLRATIPNGKKLTQLSIEGGYIQYAVTYSDGVNGDAFEDVVYKVGYGVATPKFKNGGTPTRKDYTFDKWSPELQSVVTKDITYSATWILSLTVATLTFDESYKGLQYTVKSSSGEENYEGTVEDTLKAELRLQRLSTEYVISIGTYEQKFTTGTESGTMEVTVNAN